MPREVHSYFTSRYAVAVLSFALACPLTLLLWPVKERGGFILFLAAVSLSAWYGGTVRAESAGAGRGSTFTVRLPLLAGHATGRAGGTPVSSVMRNPTEPAALKAGEG